jgi:hypothetical protein
MGETTVLVVQRFEASPTRDSPSVRVQSPGDAHALPDCRNQKTCKCRPSLKQLI